MPTLPVQAPGVLEVIERRPFNYTELWIWREFMINDVDGDVIAGIKCIFNKNIKMANSLSLPVGLGALRSAKHERFVV